MRRIAATILCAGLSLAVPARADNVAGAYSIAGSVLVTLDAECPEDYRVPLAGTSTDGSDWRFTLAGAQTGCTPRAGAPIIFEGRYVASAPPCDRVAGTGCPRSIDPERPGWISVGSLPLNVVLQETTVRYCVSTKCYQGRAFLDRSSGGTTLPVSGVRIPSAIAGLGEITPPGCSAGALKMPVSLVTDGGPVWIVVRPASVAAQCDDPVIGLLNVFTGTWAPDRGGCILSLSNPGTSVCVSSVPYSLGGATVGMSLCFPGPDCWPGTARLIRS